MSYYQAYGIWIIHHFLCNQTCHIKRGRTCMREFEISASESTIGMLQQSNNTHQTIFLSNPLSCHQTHPSPLMEQYLECLWQWTQMQEHHLQQMAHSWWTIKPFPTTRPTTSTYPDRFLSNNGSNSQSRYILNRWSIKPRLCFNRFFYDGSNNNK